MRRAVPVQLFVAMMGFLKMVTGEEAPPGMDFFNKLFPNVLAPPKPSSEPATRWEKAVAAVNGIAKQVAKIDADGVDVYCFPGSDGDEFDKNMQIKSNATLKALVAGQTPGGPATMCAALGQALDDAIERGFDPPCAMLIFTAGQPEDADGVLDLIAEKAAQVQTEADLCLTFVHIGDDPDAEEFLARLDALTVANSNGEEINICDVIKDEDMRKAMDELHDPSFMESGGQGALAGAFAGMAAGAAAYYAYNKYQAKKRTEGWNGTWDVCMQPKSEDPIGVQLTVVDDGEGNLAIEGYPEVAKEAVNEEEAEARRPLFNTIDADGDEMLSREEWDQVFDAIDSNGDGYISRKEWCAMEGGTTSLFEAVPKKSCACISRDEWVAAFDTFDDDGDGMVSFGEWCLQVSLNCGNPSTVGSYQDEGDNYVITRQGANGEFVSGEIIDEHLIEWQDDSIWVEVPPEGVNWTHMALAAAGGAAAGATMGYVMQKKFFNKANNNEPANYMIVIDRSDKMTVMDGGA